MTDHLGSTSISTNTSGTKLGEVRYYAWGSDRYTSGSMPTSYRYTGQRYDGDAIGLYYYGARYYDAKLGRFVQADTIVPEPGNPQNLNRYAYVYDNPLRYNDPSGYDPLDSNWVKSWRKAHCADLADESCQPNDNDRLVRLYSLMYRGKASHSYDWTAADWAAFDPIVEFGPQPYRQTLNDFADAVDRLSSHYEANEQAEFVSAIALAFAGVSYQP